MFDSMPCRVQSVLYLDVDGVLQYADGGCWRRRLEAEDFLTWAVRHFDCRWLTAWARPNESLPAKLGIKVPPGIVEVKWQSARVSHPFKAAAICDDEDWVWLEDEPSEFDLADLRRRRQISRLIVVDASKPFVLMGQIRNLLEERLARHAPAGWAHKLFFEGDLADYLVARWKLFLAEIQAARLAGGGGGSALVFASILARYHLKTPTLLTDFKIIEHGWREQASSEKNLRAPVRSENFGDHGDYLDAQIAHLEARLERLSSRRSYIIVESPFEGTENSWVFAPPVARRRIRKGCSVARPSAWGSRGRGRRTALGRMPSEASCNRLTVFSPPPARRSTDSTINCAQYDPQTCKPAEPVSISENDCRV